MRSLCLSVAFFALAACKTGVAPADDDYDLDQDGVERNTALGEHSVLTGPAGTHDFGRRVALLDGEIVVTERAAGTPCVNRLRVYKRGTDGTLTESTVDCTVTNPFFGEQLSAAEDELLTGQEAFWGTEVLTADGTLTAADSLPADGFGSASAMLQWDRAVVAAPGHGVSGAAYVFQHASGPWTQVAKLSHPGIAAGGRLGTTVMGSGNLVVLTDGLGRPVIFERDTTGNWLAVDAPEARVLAVQGSTLLAEPMFGADLRFYDRVNGAWVATGILHDAKGGYTEWAFDDVAAFAVQPGQGSNRGAVDRYLRIDGQLDASFRLAPGHTGLDLALDGGWLAVAEAVSVGSSGTGQVHLFDWRAERDALRMERACPQGDDAVEPNDAIAQAAPGAAGTYTLSDVSRQDHWRFTVPAGQELTITASFVQADGDVDLKLFDAAGTQLDSALTTQPTEVVSWANHGATDVEVIVQANLFTANVGCTSYTLASSVAAVTPVPPPPVVCEQADPTEPNESAASAWPTLPSGAQVASAVSAEDWFMLGDALPGGIQPGESVRIDLTFLDADGDLDLALTDPNGLSLVSSMGTTDNESVTWTNAGTAAVDARVKVKLFNPGSVPGCVPYSVSLTLL
jgi:hypothetical protein